jgi:hypothetical protein
LKGIAFGFISCVAMLSGISRVNCVFLSYGRENLCVQLLWQTDDNGREENKLLTLFPIHGRRGFLKKNLHKNIHTERKAVCFLSPSELDFEDNIAYIYNYDTILIKAPNRVFHS